MGHELAGLLVRVISGLNRMSPMSLLAIVRIARITVDPGRSEGALAAFAGAFMAVRIDQVFRSHCSSGAAAMQSGKPHDAGARWVWLVHASLPAHPRLRYDGRTPRREAVQHHATPDQR
jgi:hypothetical protein